MSAFAEGVPPAASARSTHRLSSSLVWPLAILGLVGLQVALALTHVPWRDEWQALQIAVTSSSWSTLVSNLRYEGHPILWYAVLRLASAVVPGPWALSVVQSVIAAATLAILLLRLPFPRSFRWMTGASYLVLFEYGTIARSYGLGALLLFGALALRGTVWSWVCLAAMANVSVHFLLLALAMALALWLRVPRPSPAGPAIVLAGCAASLAIIWPAADAVPAIALDPSLMRRIAGTNLEAVALIVPFNPFSVPVRWPVWVDAPASSMIGVWLPLIVYRVLRDDRRLSVIGLGLTLAIITLSVFVYPAAARHVGVVLLFVIGAQWIRAETGGAAPGAGMTIWMGVSAAFGLVMAASALTHPFTPGREVADWIRRQGLERETWVVLRSFEGVTLAGELGMSYVDLPHGCRATFQRWDAAAIRAMPPAEVSSALTDAAVRAGGRLHILAEPEELPAIPGLTVVARFPAGLTGGGKILATMSVVRVPGPKGIADCPWARP